ncbi:MAG: sigma factor, partial [Tepidiformaceae bacterium]
MSETLRGNLLVIAAGFGADFLAVVLGAAVVFTAALVVFAGAIAFAAEREVALAFVAGAAVFVAARRVAAAFAVGLVGFAGVLGIVASCSDAQGYPTFVRAGSVTAGLVRRYPCNVDESTLIAAARTDPDAFGELYDRTAPVLYRFVYSLVRDQHHTEDLVSETYRRAIDRLPTYQDFGRPFEAWLFTIARNLAIDGGRRGRREAPLMDHDTPDDAWVGEALLREEDG